MIVYNLNRNIINFLDPWKKREMILKTIHDHLRTCTNACTYLCHLGTSTNTFWPDLFVGLGSIAYGTSKDVSVLLASWGS
jgi:hypothetical protein